MPLLGPRQRRARNQDLLLLQAALLEAIEAKGLSVGEAPAS